MDRDNQPAMSQNLNATPSASLPGNQNLHDQVTPHKILLIILIRDFATTTGPNANVPLLDPAETEILNSVSEGNVMKFMLKVLQSNEITMQQFVKQLELAAPKSKFVATFMECATSIYNDGIKGLMDLMDALPKELFLEKNIFTVIGKSSVMGLFIRRMILSFEKLSFERLKKLVSRYRRYFEKFKSCHGSFLDMTLLQSEGSRKLEKHHDVNEAGKYSQRQASFFINRQCHLLEHNERAALPTVELHHQVDQLLSSNPDFAEAYFLSYLNYMRVNDYSASQQSLLKYFNRLLTPKSMHNHEDLWSYRYAALNMAALHFRFSHKSQAAVFLSEAVQMAQTAKDQTCLRLALSLMHKVGGVGPSMSANMLAKQSEPPCSSSDDSQDSLSHCSSLGIQALCRHASYTDQEPANVLLGMMQADLINCHKSLTHLNTVSLAHKAALWDVYGNQEMSSLNAQLVLNLNTSFLGVCQNAQPECLALCHLAIVLESAAEHHKAQLVFEHAELRFPLMTEFAHIWLFTKEVIRVCLALRQNRSVHARDAVQHLTVLDAREAKYWLAEVYKLEGNSSAAHNVVSTLFEELDSISHAEKQSFKSFRCRLLILKASLYYEAGNLSLAITPLAEAQNIAETHHLITIHAAAELHLAHVEMMLGLPLKALSLIEQNKSTISTHFSLFDQARAMLLWAKCNIEVVANTDKRIEVVKASVLKVALAIKWLRKCEAFFKLKDAVYYQACLYHQLGNIEERNKFAMEFRDLDENYPTFHREAILSL